MGKRFLTTLLVLCLGFGLCACGKSNQASSNDGTPSEPSASSGGNTGTTDAPSGAAGEPTAYEKLFANGPLCVQGENDLWGYIDISGNYVIEPQFADAYPFAADGMARVRDANNRLMGYIDTSGAYVIQPQFWDAYDFFDGLAVAAPDMVQIGGISKYLYGYIDTSGNMAIPAQFDTAFDFSEDLAVVKADGGVNGNIWGSFGFIDRDGNYVISPKYDCAYSFFNGVTFVGMNGTSSCALIDKNGNHLTQDIYSLGFTTYEHTKGNPRSHAIWSSNLCCVTDERSYGKVFINMDGEVVLPKTGSYADASDFCNDYAAVQDSASGLYGYIDSEGNWIISPQYAIAERFLNYSCASVKDLESGLYGCIDRTGNWIVPPQYQEIYMMGSQAVARNEDSIFVIDLDEENMGNILAEHPIDEVLDIYPSRYVYIVTLGNPYDNVKFQILNYDGTAAVEYFFDQMPLGHYADQSGLVYAKVKYNGLYGIVDGNSDWLIPAKFKDMR